MTDLATTRHTTTETAASPAMPSEPTLITEQHVRFSTAAASVAPARTRGWAHAMDSVAGAVRGFFAGPQEPARRQYPKRYAFLENALIAREMDRL